MEDIGKKELRKLHREEFALELIAALIEGDKGRDAYQGGYYCLEAKTIDLILGVVKVPGGSGAT